MNTPAHISILGGGPAGLAVGYYAKKKGIPFTIYEATNRVGGNCVTLKHGDFLFDSGAHRFHDGDAEVTEEIIRLLGGNLRKIEAPSQIYHHGKLINFPLTPLNLLKNLGVSTFTKAGLEVLRSRLGRRDLNSNFEQFALHTYGNTIADRFLLHYSEKLWGIPCHEISPSIAGKRMKGLTLRTFFKEAFHGKKTSTEHLDGAFYYPKMGYGTISQKLAECCGKKHILKNSRITKIFHDQTQIQAVEVNGMKSIEVDEVVSTLPITMLLQIMEPPPPQEILHLAERLRFRNMVLVAFFLNRDLVSENATVYFPDPDIPFTRISEPKNRCRDMAPPGKTSLIVEIPCQRGDEHWNAEDNRSIQMIRSHLLQIGWIQAEEIIDAVVYRINHAYPILEVGFEEHVKQVHTFLAGLRNLKHSGRNGKFLYAWLHTMIRLGKEIIDEQFDRI